MSPLAVENGSLVTSGGSLCETCCSPPPEVGACCYTQDGTNWICEDGITAVECAEKPNVGVNFYPGQTCGDIECPEPPPTPTGACCFFDDFTQAYACTENVTALWCGNRTDGRFFEGQTCGDITCPPIAGWYVDCYRACSDETPGLCDNCSAGPFPTHAEANDYVIANQPPPYCCDYTIVEVTRRGNPLP